MREDLHPIQKLSNQIEILLGNKIDIAKAPKLDNLVIELEDGIESLKDEIFNIVFRSENEELINRYIRVHQNNLIRLCNDLSSNIDFEFLPKVLNQNELDQLLNFYSFAHNIIEGLLTYLEESFPTYFNLNVKASKGRLIKNQLELSNKIKNLDCTHRCSLRSIAVKPILNLIKKDSATYRECYYLKGISNELAKCCGSCKKEYNQCDLQESLIQNNFNSHLFFTHLAGAIVSGLSGIKSNERKINMLFLYLKEIKQMRVDSNIVFKPEYESIQIHIEKYIKEEIEYFSNRLPEKEKKEVCDSLDEDFFIETGFSSSAEIGCYLRVLVEAGLYKKKNIRRLISLYTNSIRTLGNEPISAGTVRNNFYKPDDEVMKIVRGKVLKILSETQKER